ncbi:MAG: hypothetical protein Q9208_002025 [Pyrenodesmia sp. 3 TL-2023]
MTKIIGLGKSHDRNRVAQIPKNAHCASRNDECQKHPQLGQQVGTCLTQKPGPLKCNKHHSRLCHRRKRSRSRLLTSPGKRLKPGSRQPIEAKTSSDPTHTPASDALIKEQNLADPSDDSDSDDENPWGWVSEEDAEDIRLGDTERITAFIRQTADYLGQMLLKTILKALIKLYEPAKQTRFPYNGGDRPSDDPKNPGRDTAPPWWPEQAHWRDGFGCRHREPDHVFKKERLFLTPRILRLTRTDEPTDPTPRNFSVKRLQEATDQISMSPEQRKLLKQLYRLREDEQAYEEGGKDADDVTYLRKIKPQVGRGKNRVAQIAQGVEDVEPEFVSSPESVSHIVARQTSESPAASRYSSFDSINSNGIKLEQGSPHADYPGLMPEPSPQYTCTFGTQDMFNPGEHFTLDPAAELRPIYAGNNQLQQTEEDYAQAMRIPYPEGPGANVCAMAEPSLYPSIDSGGRGRAPVRSDNARPTPRPSSVQKVPTSTWIEWPPRSEKEHQWNFQDDTTFKLKQPRQSDGRPNLPPEVPLFGPGSHPHGLPLEQQLPLCVANNCPCSHTHGWRTVDEQLRICAAYRCTMHPLDMPGIYIDPRDPRFMASNPEFFNSYFAESRTMENQAFDVTKSFP